jgi:hypothetical protein
MAHALTIELSEDVFRTLQTRAAQQGQTPETLAAECVAKSVRAPADDPLLKWAGAFESEVPDAAERHDYYLGEALHKELRSGQGK